jgi:hypothetical protein
MLNNDKTLLADADIESGSLFSIYTHTYVPIQICVPTTLIPSAAGLSQPSAKHTRAV